MRVLGMQSGTSLDAIDTALIDLQQDTDDPTILRGRVIDVREQPWPTELRAELLALLDYPEASLAELALLDARCGDAFAAAAKTALDAAGGADLIVSHGQTIQHLTDPESLRTLATWQIGDAFRIAQATDTPVLHDVRRADVAAGGDGAPLAPILDALLLADTAGHTALVNIGGISNLTLMADGQLRAAGDAGPGNALIDIVATRASKGERTFDEDGRLAASGTVHPGLLARMLADPYLQAQTMRSTGRERFSAAWLDARIAETFGESAADSLSDADLAATVTELTAAAIAHVLDRSSAPDARIVLTGGGARNPYLVERIATRCAPRTVSASAHELGVPSSAKEAVLFAVIGYLASHGWSGALPVVLGSLTPPHAALTLPRDPHPVPPHRLIMEVPA